jgi:hypothetical protein
VPDSFKELQRIHLKEGALKFRATGLQGILLTMESSGSPRLPQLKLENPMTCFNHPLKFRKLAPFFAIAGFALAPRPADAATTFESGFSGTVSEVFSATQFSYAADVSNSDLINGMTPAVTLADWNTTNNAHPNELTDGIHGIGFNIITTDKVQGAWTKSNLSSATYTLGTGANGLGFDITSVQSIADWVNVGFGNQAWKIDVKPVGGSYSTLATVDYQPLGKVAPNDIGTTKVTLSNLNATGIESIRITSNSVNGGTNAGAFVWREFDVFGAPTTAVDGTPPLISTLSPSNGTTDVPLGTNLVATFSETVAIGTGNITIQDLDTPSQTVITLPDARVSVSGPVLTINLDADLAANTNYAIRIDATAIDDIAGNSFAGITNDTTWAFSTVVPDLTAPLASILSPADDSTDVSSVTNLVATFSENIAIGSGDITIRNLDTLSDTVITLPDARVSVSGAVLTINPSTNLAATTDYSIHIAATAITDIAGNPFAGISDDTIWNFDTATVPLRIMCMGDSITTGYTDNPGWVNHPFEFGYRSGLYTLLSNAGYNFLFVGGSTEPWTGISGDPTQGGTYTPPLDLRTFGQDGHRGYGGKTASFLNSNILSWLATDNPDIILLKIGTNSQDQSGLETLVNTITTTKPDCHLIIAQIMPKYTYQQGIVNYNTYIRDTLVPAQQALGRNVTLVDQYAPFLTNAADLTTIDPSLFSNGINHPDNDGYDKMAQVWFDGIEALGIGPNSYTGWISDPAFGIAPGQQGLDQDPDGDGIANGIENILGTNPGAFSQGLSSGPVNAAAGTFIFTHPLNPTPAPELTATYRWSKNLTTFTDAGNALEGTTVTFSRGSRMGGVVTVTASVTGTPLDRLFIDIKVQQN